MADISSKGLGVVFKDRKIIRYFKENSVVIFSLVLPGNKAVSMMSIVRHIDILENKVIKIGFEIMEVDEFTRDLFNEFIKSGG